MQYDPVYFLWTVRFEILSYNQFQDKEQWEIKKTGPIRDFVRNVINLYKISTLIKLESTGSKKSIQIKIFNVSVHPFVRNRRI